MSVCHCRYKKLLETGGQKHVRVYANLVLHKLMDAIRDVADPELFAVRHARVRVCVRDMCDAARAALAHHLMARPCPPVSSGGGGAALVGASVHGHAVPA